MQERALVLESVQIIHFSCGINLDVVCTLNIILNHSLLFTIETFQFHGKCDIV